MVFFTLDEDGDVTDRCIVDEMLEHEDEIDAELVRRGILDPPIVLRRAGKEEE